MISGLLKKIFGSRNDRLIRQYSAVVRQINALEAGVSALTDDALRAKTDEFKARPLIRCCRRRLPWCVKPASEPSECGTSTCS